jgi:hypothetical protein
MDIIQANPGKPWRWHLFSENPNITWDFIEANPDKPWDWKILSRNPNITWDHVEANPDKPWDWEYVFLQKFRPPLAEIERNARRFLAARKIQRVFKEAYYNPGHAFCKRRLMREFTDLKGELGH